MMHLERSLGEEVEYQSEFALSIRFCATKLFGSYYYLKFYYLCFTICPCIYSDIL